MRAAGLRAALGSIPAILHTDHATITRLDALPLARAEPKQFRSMSELLQGGSRLLYRPSTGALRVGPDAISRNPEWRDRLILAKASEWGKPRAMSKGVQFEIEKGAFDDGELEMIEPPKHPPDSVKPLLVINMFGGGPDRRLVGDPNPASPACLTRARKRWTR